jgi:4-hydroxybenzoate polyprenyltransferase
VTAAIVLIAGGPAAVALRLGVAMTALQFAIGALNDLADRERDLGRPEKPIAAGTVPAVAARIIVVSGLIIGLGLSAVAGPAVLAVALIGSGAGLFYDLTLKGTPWAPVAYAIGSSCRSMPGWGDR